MSEKKVNYGVSTVADMTNGIILARFEKDSSVRETSYQSEAQLENTMIENLVSQGYQRLAVRTNEELYKNLKTQIEKLNEVSFSDSEWRRFLLEYLDCPSDTMIEKLEKYKKTTSTILHLTMED